MQLAGHTSVTDALGILCRAVYDPRADDAAFRLSLQGELRLSVVRRLIWCGKTTLYAVKYLTCKYKSMRRQQHLDR